MFGKKKYQQLLKDYEQLEKDYQGLQQTSEMAKSQLDAVHHLMKQYEIIDWVENKRKQSYYVCLSGSETDLTIELIAVNQPLTYLKAKPHLYAEVSHVLTKDLEWTNRKECQIHDIQVITDNSGNGSLLLEALFKVIQKLDSGFVTVIKGELAYTDRADFDKLEHFYRKHGFEVTFDAQRTSGFIRKNL